MNQKPKLTHDREHAQFEACLRRMGSGPRGKGGPGHRESGRLGRSI